MKRSATIVAVIIIGLCIAALWSFIPHSNIRVLSNIEIKPVQSTNVPNPAQEVDGATPLYVGGIESRAYAIKNGHVLICNWEDASCHTLEGADSDTFVVLRETPTAVYAKDKNHVYSGPTVVPNADPRTFDANGL